MNFLEIVGLIFVSLVAIGILFALLVWIYYSVHWIRVLCDWIIIPYTLYIAIPNMETKHLQDAMTVMDNSQWKNSRRYKLVKKRSNKVILKRKQL